MCPVPLQHLLDHVGLEVDGHAQRLRQTLQRQGRQAKLYCQMAERWALGLQAVPARHCEQIDCLS
jgi:hypothetical protein